MHDKQKKILIVEDEVFIAEELSAILKELNYEVTEIAFNAESAIESLNSNPPDLAILDIRMNGENQGFKIAKYINENLDIPFIFLTSFSDERTVVEASLLKPSAYVLKPFSDADIFSTLSIVFQSFQAGARNITIKIGRDSIVLDPEEILWIKSDDNYVELRTEDKRHLVRSTIDGFIEKYSLNNFIRAHRSYAVNIAKIESMNSKQMIINGVEIPISKKYIAGLRKALE